jgi:hypothetical protein
MLSPVLSRTNTLNKEDRMTPQELSTRQARAEHETLVISKTEQGFRVYAPAGKARPYFVTGTAEEPSCTCPDFQNHKEDLAWRCKHVLAVFRDEDDKSGANSGNGGAPGPVNGARQRPNGPAQMILKRSVSPDGRIDALSVEFAYPVASVASQEIERQAGAVLKLQHGIVTQFLNGNGANGSGEPAKPAASPTLPALPSDEPISAELLSVGGSDGKWGRRLFINVVADGRILRLYGSPKQLADHLKAAGAEDLAEDVKEGMKLEVACRVLTKPSKDGRYVNVEKVLPVDGDGASQ